MVRPGRGMAMDFVAMRRDVKLDGTQGVKL